MVAHAPEIEVFHAIADPTRRRMLDLLADAETPATRLVEHFAMSQPAVSQHLRVLREAGLVTVRRVGRQRLYQTKGRALKEVFDWVAHYERFWKDKLDALGAYLDQPPGSEGETTS